MPDRIPKYSIDTSALIEMRRRYPIDVFPRVWELVENLISGGIIIATDEVKEEIEKQEDGLTEWTKNQNGLFVPIDESIQIEVTNILSGHSNLVDTKRNKSGADPFVIALAKLNNCSVVSEEQPSRSPQASKIPDVCHFHDVECIKLLEMLRREGLS